MTKIAPAILEEILSQVDSVENTKENEAINEDETIEPTRNKIDHLGDSPQISLNALNTQETIDQEKGK